MPRKRWKTPDWEITEVVRNKFYDLFHKGRLVLSAAPSSAVYNHVLGQERGRVDVLYQNRDGLSATMSLEEALEIGL